VFFIISQYIKTDGAKNFGPLYYCFFGGNLCHQRFRSLGVSLLNCYYVMVYGVNTDICVCLCTENICQLRNINNIIVFLNL
jgi:hypothetical protein